MNDTKSIIFEGAATALITPFRDGCIDFPALERLIDFQIAGGISALVIAGTTGEASTLTSAEHAALIGAAVRYTKGRVPIIAGCGSNSTAVACRLAESARDAGADGLLAVTPYYNKATPEGLYRHYIALADTTDLPLILYNVPSRTTVDIPISVCKRLSEHPRIIGIKEASSSITKSADIIAACGSDFAVWSGNDDMILPIMALGGRGVISVLSNLFPAEVSELCRAQTEGRHLAAASIQLRYAELIKALFAQVNPIPVKTAMAALGDCRGEFRLPLCPLSEKERSVLLDTVMKYAAV